MPELARMKAAVQAICKALGVGPEYLSIVLAVGASEGLMTKQAIYDSGESSRTARRRIERLQKKGLIEARASEADKRATLLFLSPKAKAALA